MAGSQAKGFMTMPTRQIRCRRMQPCREHRWRLPATQKRTWPDYWNEELMATSSATLTEFANLLFDKRDQIAYISVNRPKVLNALNMETMEELGRAFTA